MGGVWSRSSESLLCELWGNFGGILEHGSIHLSASAVAERYFFGKFIPEVPSKSGSGRVGRTKTVPDFRVNAFSRLASPFLQCLDLINLINWTEDASIKLENASIACWGE